MAEEHFPMFSVVVPVYNRQDMIVETLESLDNQSFRNFEAIFVDDGSTDDSAKRLSESGRKVIRQENGGPGAARNAGAQAAAGRYLAFLDSDDRWFRWSLQVYADVIREFDFPAFVTGRPMLFFDGEEADPEVCEERKIEAFADYFGASDRWRWFGVSSFVVRRDAFEKVGGFADGRINGEDADLAMRLGTQAGFVHIASPQQFAYRVHDGNVTNVAEKSQAGLQRLIERERNGDYPGGAERECERAEIIARHVRPFAVDCAKQGRLAVAGRFYAAVFNEALKSGRWRFLLGLPVLSAAGAVRRVLGWRKG